MDYTTPGSAAHTMLASHFSRLVAQADAMAEQLLLEEAAQEDKSQGKGAGKGAQAGKKKRKKGVRAADSALADALDPVIVPVPFCQSPQKRSCSAAHPAPHAAAQAESDADASAPVASADLLASACSGAERTLTESLVHSSTCDAAAAGSNTLDGVLPRLACARMSSLPDVRASLPLVRTGTPRTAPTAGAEWRTVESKAQKRDRVNSSRVNSSLRGPASVALDGAVTPGTYVGEECELQCDAAAELVVHDGTARSPSTGTCVELYESARRDACSAAKRGGQAGAKDDPCKYDRTCDHQAPGGSSLASSVAGTEELRWGSVVGDAATGTVHFDNIRCMRSAFGAQNAPSGAVGPHAASGKCGDGGALLERGEGAWGGVRGSGAETYSCVTGSELGTPMSASPIADDTAHLVWYHSLPNAPKVATDACTQTRPACEQAVGVSPWTLAGAPCCEVAAQTDGDLALAALVQVCAHFPRCHEAV